jgi:hypothetical protein
LGNGHFKKANDWLFAKYGADGMVDWCNLDVQTVLQDNGETESTPQAAAPSTSTTGDTEV